MKAIMINAFIKTAYFCDLSDNSHKRISELHDRIACRFFSHGYTFQSGSVLYVDDEGLLRLNNDSMFFSVGDSPIFAGNGVITGPELDLENDYIIEDVNLSIEELKIKFYSIEEVTFDRAGFAIIKR